MGENRRDSRLPTRSKDANVDAFLERVAATPAPRPDGGRGRLMFAMDATASRAPTWDTACQIQGQMFEETAALGGLEVQLVFYRGFGECRNSHWVTDSKSLVRRMSRVLLPGRPYPDRPGPGPRHQGIQTQEGRRAGFRWRLHGGGRRPPLPPRRRARPVGRARVRLPRGRRADRRAGLQADRAAEQRRLLQLRHGQRQAASRAVERGRGLCRGRPARASRTTAGAPAARCCGSPGR